MRLMLLASLAVLSGCASQYNDYCQTPIRDLTQPFETRDYMCLPQGYSPAITPQEQAKAIKELKLKELELSNPKFEKGANLNTPTYQPIKKNLEVNFTKHNLDTDFSTTDLIRVVDIIKSSNNNDIIKLQGCRRDNEAQQLILGRALKIREALKANGIDNKIVILANSSCNLDKKVMVMI
ncbi:hypothetical protein AwWohl_01280 [Gammaproteobacteria bacterium]|nr:hypothetical protein AwWohl_01280 [Gammaproteobacteria bacterium]